MQTTARKTVTCPFCGKKRSVTIYEEDGMDYYGHQRGSFSSRTADNGCDCPFGLIERKKTNIKSMCLNCKYNKDNKCTNKKELESVSSLFNVGDSLSIKDNTRKCEYWELDKNIFLSLLD